MQVSAAVLPLLFFTLTLIPAFHSQSKIPESVNQPATCCLKYHGKELPRRLVMGYTKALNCQLPAIIFITKKNREICANPNDDWVQNHIKNPDIPLLPPRNLARIKIARPRKTQPEFPNSPR